MEFLFQDLRFAFRSLAKSPGLVAVAVATLALGIGANSTLFSVVNGVLLEPLPYPEPERLVRVFDDSARFPLFPVAPANFLDHREALGDTGAGAVYLREDAELTAGEQSQRIAGMRVSAGFFGVLALPPQIGRDLERADELPGAEAVVVLGHDFWQKHFEADPGAVGRTVDLDGVPHKIVGVAPPGLQHVGGTYRSLPHGAAVDAWRPLALDPENVQRGSHYLNFLLRLAPGVSHAEALARLNATQERLAAEYPDTNTGWKIVAVPLDEEIVGAARPMLRLLMGAVTLVLAIAVANVANLLLVRATARSHEIGVRRALGAGTWRLVRQTLTESSLLAGAGGLAGLAVAYGGVEALKVLSPEGLPRLHAIEVDLRVAAFAAAVAVVSGLVFGCAPAFHMARTSLRETLAGTAGAVTGGRGRLRRALVIGELGLSIVLLAGAGLLIESFFHLRGAEPGFEAERVLAATVSLPAARYPDRAAVAAFPPRLLERFEALPGVTSAGAGTDLPWTGYDENMTVIPEDRVGEPGAERTRTRFHIVTPGYFETLGVPILSGREFDDRDDREAPQRVIINRRLAEVGWPDRDPVGRRLTWSMNPEESDLFEIVGVVGDVKDSPRDADLLPAIFFPHAQQTWRNSLIVAVRTTVEPRAVVAAMRAELRALDPDLPLAEVRTLDEVADRAYAEPRFLSLLVGGFAALALTLAVVGLYGVMSYSVGRRGREMAVRQAMGARASHLVRLVLAQGMKVVAVGAVFGVAGALAATRLLQGLLYGVEAGDPWILSGVVAVLAAVTVVANLLPARRAARVDPAAALRDE